MKGIVLLCKWIKKERERDRDTTIRYVHIGLGIWNHLNFVDFLFLDLDSQVFSFEDGVLFGIKLIPRRLQLIPR